MNPHLQRGLMLLEQSRHDLAEDELRQALGQDPDDAMAHAVLAICLARQEKYRDASQEAETAIHLAPDEAYVFYAHAIVLERRNHYAEARQAIEEAIGLDPYQTEFFAQLAAIHLAQQHWQPALEAAEQGLACDPEDVACTNLRAMALVKLGRNTEAGSAIETALKRAPENAHAHANMGWNLIERGQHEQAMQHFREALRLEPEMEWARIGIVEAMKARYFIYRIMLNWFLWMAKLTKGGQWRVILGAYIGYHILRRVAAANPNLAPWLTPLLVIYIAFAIMTWVANPLFNLALRLNRFGRLALSDEQIRTSNWVGLCVLGAVGFVAAYFFQGAEQWLYCALACGLLIPVLAHIYHCSPGWPRATIVLIAIGMIGLAGVIVMTSIGEVVLSGNWLETMQLIGGLAFILFIVTAIAAQFGVHALVAARPRLGGNSARKTWLIGGGVLGLFALAFLAFSALLAYVAFVDSQLVLFNLPIRAEYVRQDEQVAWEHADELAEATTTLTDRGFVRVGDFTLAGMPGFKVRYLLHEDEAVVAELLEGPRQSLITAVLTVYADDRVWIYGNRASPSLTQPPGITEKILDVPAEPLYERLLRERPADDIRPLRPDQVIETASRLYARVLDFQLRRGGPNRAEMRAMLQAAGHDDAGDATIARFQRLWRQQATAKVDPFVIDLLRRENEKLTMVDPQQCLCIHGLLNPQALLEYYRRCDARRSRSEARRLVDDALQGRSPREAFGKLAAGLPSVQRIGSTTEPLPTDVYWMKN